MISDFSLLSDLFADTSSRQKFVDKAVDVLQQFTLCECVGIRILHSDGSLPYHSYRGFSHDFWVAENCLSLKDECVCTRLIKDSVMPIDQALLTEVGSVWTNELQAFADSIPQHLRDCYRGKCVQSQFESLGVIILKGNQEAVGMIHIADTRQGMLPPETMRAIESLSNVIGAVVLRFRIEDELRSAIEIAEKASNSKSEFLANMSHEIRTPMTVFMAAIEHLLQADCSPEQRHLLELAEQSAKRLRTLIDDILDFSRIEARKVNIEEEPFDFRACMGEAIDMFTLAAQQQNLRLETEISSAVPELVIGDPNRLGQVLTNLIGNAVKFTQEGEIRVRVQPCGDFLKFSVADTGIGIPEEKCHLLFESFTQVDSSFTRKFGGTGLGLAISKGLVDLMGGEISVRSSEAKGSVFTFTIPLKNAGEKTGGTNGASSKDSDKEIFNDRILLAEDDPLIQNIITLTLERRGWQVETTESGLDAIEKWQRGNFDLILMDLQMPEMNGIEATRAIRERELQGGKRTCIIGLTAHAQHEIMDDCLNAGMDRVITKPIQMKDLYSAIGNCFK